jgi:hypothetical protein
LAEIFDWLVHGVNKIAPPKVRAKPSTNRVCQVINPYNKNSLKNLALDGTLAREFHGGGNLPFCRPSAAGHASIYFSSQWESLAENPNPFA